MNGSL